MRLIKMIGLAAVAAVAAMAFVGATSTSAASTQLCGSHTTLTCSIGATSVNMFNQGSGALLSKDLSVECDDILVAAAPLALASPQQIHVSSLTFFGCEADAGDECEIEVFELPLANLNKTGLDAGTLTLTSGRIFLLCENVDIFGTDFECEYDGTGLEFTVGAQHLTANETPVSEIGSDFLCPQEPTLEGLLSTLELTPITVLCKTHTEPCAEKDQVKSVDMSTKAPVLYNTVANVECESSLAAATVLGPAESQKLDVTTLNWKECHTLGAAENCTVTTSALPTIDLEATALNLGSAETLSFEIEVDCLILDLIKLDCTFGSDVTLEVEGALHKEASGHGRFVSAKTELELAKGGEHCPDEMKWDASYEAAEHLYVLPSFTKSGSHRYILQ